jgi:hypothetical protein
MRLSVLLALALFSSQSAWAGCDSPATGLVINEFLPDPDGADSSVLEEWVELYNSSSETLDITGVELRKATSGDSYGLEATIADQVGGPDVLVMLAPGEYYVIGETNVFAADYVSGATLALGTGANGDGVQIRDCGGAILDTVVYGDQDNMQAVIDDSGEIATSLAPKPGAGETVARRQDGVDTGASADDFWVPTTASLGTANPAPPVCSASQGGVVINEFVANPSGVDAAAMLEFVELYNGGGTTVALEGWRIEGVGIGSYSTKYTFGESASIGAESWLAAGEANVNGATIVTETLALGSGSHGDGLRLVDCDGTIVDTVVYGEDNDDAIADDDGSITRFAGKPSDDEAIARLVDGVDTNNSADDFFLTDELTPGARNPSAPVCIASANNIVINEFLANPPGADGDVRLEWVELFNGGDNAILLDDWTLNVATQGDSYSTRATFPAGTSIPADGHLLLGELNVTAADVVIASTLGLGSGLRADGVRLIDCNGTTVDTVVYGNASNEDAVTDDNGVATGVAPTPGDGVALGRRQDGQDTDDSGADFVASTSPTPGASNPVFQCFPTTGDLLLNEALVDPGGSDSDAMTEWVELFNRSGDELRVDGWSLVFASNGDDSAPDVLFPPESAVAPLGFFVAGDVNAPETDVVVAMAIGNGSGGDAIQLIDCEGTLVDVVVYGGSNEDGLLDESGAFAVAVATPGSDATIARAEDGADTDDAADWVVDTSPTPGATNVSTTEPGSGVPPASGGCGGNSAPGGSAPEGGCGADRELSNERGCSTTPLPLGGFEVLMAGLIGVRRRRRRL